MREMPKRNRNRREEKVNHILQASLKVLATKGYENATIADISNAAHVSRGILHYYFTDKEDLVSKALAKSSSSLIQSSLVGIKGNSVEEVVDEILNRYLVNLQQHPEFYAFLFEMWCASRRSKKIKNELEGCIEKVVISIEKLLENAGNNSSMLMSSHDESKEIAKALLALSDGIAFHLLINHSENLKNKKFWSLIKNMMLAVLKRR
jgi:AcrR family transcriptional regulator